MSCQVRSLRAAEACAAKVLFRLARSKAASSLVGWGFAHVSWLLPVDKLYESSQVLAFHHPRPSHRVHVLIVPKRAVRSFLHLDEDDAPLLGDIVAAAQHLVRELELDEAGYRLLVNGGHYQEVGQLHFHLVSDS